jgi:hypothetical protein
MVKISSFRQNCSEKNKLINKERHIMIDLTDPAKAQIEDYFQGREPTPIRIFLNSGG